MNGGLHRYIPGDYQREILYYHFQHTKDVVKQTYTSLPPGKLHFTLDTERGFVESEYVDPATHSSTQGVIWAGP